MLKDATSPGFELVNAISTIPAALTVSSGRYFFHRQMFHETGKRFALQAASYSELIRR
jgi:hypothetical protein